MCQTIGGGRGATRYRVGKLSEARLMRTGNVGMIGLDFTAHGDSNGTTTGAGADRADDDSKVDYQCGRLGGKGAIGRPRNS